MKKEVTLENIDLNNLEEVEELYDKIIGLTPEDSKLRMALDRIRIRLLNSKRPKSYYKEHTGKILIIENCRKENTRHFIVQASYVASTELLCILEEDILKYRLEYFMDRVDAKLRRCKSTKELYYVVDASSIEGDYGDCFVKMLYKNVDIDYDKVLKEIKI